MRHKMGKDEMTAPLNYAGTPRQTVTTMEALPARLVKRMNLLFTEVGDECITNPFSYESFEVMESETVIYDARALLTLMYSGEPLPAFAFFNECRQDKWCINPRHANMKVYKVPSADDSRFFGADNAAVIRIVVSRHDVFSPANMKQCWDNPLGDENLVQVRQLLGVTFSKWKQNKCDAVEQTGYTLGCRNVKCVNPFHKDWSVTHSTAATTRPVPSSKTLTPFEIAQQAAKRKSLWNTRQREFKQFLKHDIISARDKLICPSQKIAYQDEATALKARQKWYDLELNTFSGENAYVYHCSCGHWHMTKQNQELWSTWQKELVATR